MAANSGRTENTVKGNQKPTSGNSVYNSLDMMMRNFIDANVNTAAVVTVTGCDEPGPEGAAGYVTVKPLVAPVDNFGEAMPTAEAFQLPFLRYQAGKAAVVLDPQPGDIGLAVYTKSDSSGVGQGQPASNRTFDAANGFYIGGFSNQAPEIFIELNKEGEINIKAKADITIETEGDIKMAAANIAMKAATVTIDGVTSSTGGWSNSGGMTNNGGLINNGGISNNGGLTNNGGMTNSGGSTVSNGISLEEHTHTGDSGGTTSAPN